MCERFGVGRLSNPRGRIVHDREIIPIHSLLLKYIEALYIDVLTEKLGLAWEFWAESVIKEPEFSLNKFLRQS